MRCEKLRFDQWCTLGAPDVPVGPSLLDARPKGVASPGKVGESRGAGKPWCPCPFCPRRRAAAIPTPCHGEHPRPGRAILASSGEPLDRRKVCRLLTVKKKGAHRLRRAEVSRQLKKRLYSGRGLWYADNKCLQDFVGTDDRSAGLHHILSHYVEKRQMNVRSVFAALYTA